MAMWDGLEDFLAEPLAKFHDALLVARWTEVAAFARESQKILMPALFASDPGKAVVEVTAVEISIDDLPDIGTEEPILFFKPFLIDLLKRFEMVSTHR